VRENGSIRPESDPTPKRRIQILAVSRYRRFFDPRAWFRKG
jgi:hypothetical protein